MSDEWLDAGPLWKLRDFVDRAKTLHWTEFGPRHGYRMVWTFDTPDVLDGLAFALAVAVPKLEPMLGRIDANWEGIALVAGLESAILAGPRIATCHCQRIGPGRWRLEPGEVRLLGHPEACERLLRITLAAGELNVPYAGVDVDGDGAADEYWLMRGADGRLRPVKAEEGE